MITMIMCWKPRSGDKSSASSQALIASPPDANA